MQYMGNFGRTDHETCELCDWMLGDKTIAELALTKPDPETDRDARINSEYAYHSRYEVCPRKDTIALWPRSDKGLPNCNFCTQKGIERTATRTGCFSQETKKKKLENQKKRMSLRKISQHLLELGYVNERGKPYNAQSIKDMVNQ